MLQNMISVSFLNKIYLSVKLRAINQKAKKIFILNELNTFKKLQVKIS
jgi:hypothetical protein